MCVYCVCVRAYFKLAGDLQFWGGDSQAVVHQDHGEDGDEDGKVTDDRPHLERRTNSNSVSFDSFSRRFNPE